MLLRCVNKCSEFASSIVIGHIRIVLPAMSQRRSARNQPKIDAFLKKEKDDTKEILDGIGGDSAAVKNGETKVVSVKEEAVELNGKSKNKVVKEETSELSDTKAKKIKHENITEESVDVSEGKPKKKKVKADMKKESETTNLLQPDWYNQNQSKTFVGAHLSIAGIFYSVWKL